MRKKPAFRLVYHASRPQNPAADGKPHLITAKVPFYRVSELALKAATGEVCPDSIAAAANPAFFCCIWRKRRHAPVFSAKTGVEKAVFWRLAG
jgi:hypothetical protein